jgi:hypothetical protein
MAVQLSFTRWPGAGQKTPAGSREDVADCDAILQYQLLAQGKPSSISQTSGCITTGTGGLYWPPGANYSCGWEDLGTTVWLVSITPEALQLGQEVLVLRPQLAEQLGFLKR